jgi:hypothetical protein
LLRHHIGERRERGLEPCTEHQTGRRALRRSRETRRQRRGDLRECELDRKAARECGADGLDETWEREAALPAPGLRARIDGARAFEQWANTAWVDERRAENDDGKCDEKRSQMSGRSA